VTADLTAAERTHLDRAVELSRSGMRAREGGPFGAVVVLDGTVVGEGWNRVTSTADPTAHAEVVAIRDACLRVGSFQLTGAVVYASCEPCPMCWGAIHWARCARVVYANDAADAAAIDFDDALLTEELRRPTHQRSIEVVHVPSDDARAVFDEWAADPDVVRY
jgi:guanine deaminase